MKLLIPFLIILVSFCFSGCFATHAGDIHPAQINPKEKQLYSKMNCLQIKAELDFDSDEYSRLRTKQWEKSDGAINNSIAVGCTIIGLPFIPLFSRFNNNKDVERLAFLKGKQKHLHKLLTLKNCYSNYNSTYKIDKTITIHNE